MKLNSVVKYFFILLTVAISFSCADNGAGEVQLTEMQRLPSKDHKVDAVLVEAEAGATASTGTHILIVKPGMKIKQADLKYSILSCDHASLLKVYWAENKKLIISYDKARIFNYTNFWESADVDNWTYVVEIFLNCKSTDHQLNGHDRNSRI
jgi:hypothetical protein